MTQKIFVTATNTDIGKTYVSALIAKELHNKNKKVAYFKAAISGASTLDCSDAAYVRDYANLKTEDLFVSYLFKEPLSPHLAARLNKEIISLDKIKEDFNKIKDYDYILGEGSGGIVCPLYYEDDNKLMLYDVVQEFHFSTIVVSHATLGSINNAITTIEFLRTHNIKIKGIILNNYDENDFMQVDNLKMIESLSNIKVIATVKTNGGLDMRYNKDISEYFDE